MSRGLWALSKDDQRAVVEWRRLRDLSAACEPDREWPRLLAAFLLAFTVGALLARIL